MLGNFVLKSFNLLDRELIQNWCNCGIKVYHHCYLLPRAKYMFGRVGCNLMCGHLLPIVSGCLGRKGYVFDCHGLWGVAWAWTHCGRCPWDCMQGKLDYANLQSLGSLGWGTALLFLITSCVSAGGEDGTGSELWQDSMKTTKCWGIQFLFWPGARNPTKHSLCNSPKAFWGLLKPLFGAGVSCSCLMCSFPFLKVSIASQPKHKLVRIASLMVLSVHTNSVCPANSRSWCSQWTCQLGRSFWLAPNSRLLDLPCSKTCKLPGKFGLPTWALEGLVAGHSHDAKHWTSRCR